MALESSKIDIFQNDQNRSWDMSQDALCPNVSQKVQKEVSQMAIRNLSCVILLGGLSVNLNYLNMKLCKEDWTEIDGDWQLHGFVY